MGDSKRDFAGCVVNGGEGARGFPKAVHSAVAAKSSEAVCRTKPLGGKDVTRMHCLEC